MLLLPIIWVDFGLARRRECPLRVGAARDPTYEREPRGKEQDRLRAVRGFEHADVELAN